MSQIYKINHVIDNKIVKIFVFVGSYDIKKASTGYKYKTKEGLVEIFTSVEWKNIKENNIES